MWISLGGFNAEKKNKMFSHYWRNVCLSADQWPWINCNWHQKHVVFAWLDNTLKAYVMKVHGVVWRHLNGKMEVCHSWKHPQQLLVVCNCSFVDKWSVQLAPWCDFKLPSLQYPGFIPLERDFRNVTYVSRDKGTFWLSLHG